MPMASIEIPIKKIMAIFRNTFSIAMLTLHLANEIDPVALGYYVDSDEMSLSRCLPCCQAAVNFSRLMPKIPW